MQETTTRAWQECRRADLSSGWGTKSSGVNMRHLQAQESKGGNRGADRVPSVAPGTGKDARMSPVWLLLEHLTAVGGGGPALSSHLSASCEGPGNMSCPRCGPSQVAGGRSTPCWKGELSGGGRRPRSLKPDHYCVFYEDGLLDR